MSDHFARALVCRPFFISRRSDQPQRVTMWPLCLDWESPACPTAFFLWGANEEFVGSGKHISYPVIQCNASCPVSQPRGMTTVPADWGQTTNQFDNQSRHDERWYIALKANRRRCRNRLGLSTRGYLWPAERTVSYSGPRPDVVATNRMAWHDLILVEACDSLKALVARRESVTKAKKTKRLK